MSVLRLLALVYLVAFASLARQLGPLLGAGGLLPAADYLARARAHLGAAAYWRIPTLFWWLGASDAVMNACSWLGVALSLAALAGATNALLQIALWALYLSFVHVGQIFYGYGWEIQLLETGFLAVFLCPLRSIAPLPRSATPRVVVWLLRWLVFRVMLGAALIKLRGDPCWRDLTCLDYHFETQPNPNPLAWWLHRAPHAVHVLGVLLNHFVELVVPWFAFGPRRWRHAAGALLVGFQLTLIASGNLSFLNWLTIVPALACFDDTALGRLLPTSRRAVLLERFERLGRSRPQAIAARVLAIVVGVLSVAPVVNLASCDQAMNTSFDPLDLVNTYGAFGSVDRRRHEVIIEGTSDPVPDQAARWREYELPCMPGDPRRRPCVVSPYHHRLDWQMWFVGNGAARGESIDEEPWLVHLVWQLLAGEPSPRSLLSRDPFPDAPPRWIRADIWRYAFTRSRAREGAWWTRERVGRFLRPVSRDDPALRAYLADYGWADGPSSGGSGDGERGDGASGERP
ncbi:MAG TPA: lipase maturation factor family protein [Polyangiaceae bacterium]|nr:lipase maturation factor family protein [Polyangiaceae bacterium]